MNTGRPDDTTASREDSRNACDKNDQVQTDNGDEKRKHRRLSVQNLNMQTEIPLATRVTVINMSSGGVLVKADRRLNIGNTYLLKIGYRDNLLFVRAVVKWSFLVESVEDTNGNVVPLYMAGMHFKEVTSGKEDEIIHAIMADLEADASQFIEHAETCGSKEELDMLHDASNEETREDPEIESINMVIRKIENEHALCTEHTLSYYELLDVADKADADDIKKAYYRKVKEFHPDRHIFLPDEAKEKLNVIFSYLNEVYETLMNHEQRVHYDKTLLIKQSGNLSNRELARQYFEQGKIEFWNGNYEEAEILFQHVLYLSSASAKYFYYHAKTLLKLGKFREAERAIRKALKLDSSNSDYLTEAGYIYHALGLSNRAEENFEMALGVEPSHVKAQQGIQGIRATRANGNMDETLFNPVKVLKKIIAK